MIRRVLVVHNAYRQRGGEDSVVEAELALLRGHGHDVLEYRRHNDDVADMSKAALASDTIWSRRTVDEMSALIGRSRPSLIHVHNTFPLVSPSLYWAAARAGVPVVQTLHNFRLLCPQAMFLRGGRVCENCLGRLPWRAVAHGCYRDSRPQSALLAGMLAFHRATGTWRDKVARYIALNEFCRQKFIEGGLPAERIVVKPNFVDAAPLPLPSERDGVVFVGRLAAEKGIETLVQAAAKVGGLTTRVVGDGPEAGRLAGVPGVVALGRLDAKAVREQLSGATALVFPSIWYETFGLTIVEAFAAGTPVIGSRLGVVPDLVEDGVTGLLFEPGNATDLAAKLRWAQANPQRMAEMGLAARARYERFYTADRNYNLLTAIYRDVVTENNRSRITA